MLVPGNLKPKTYNLQSRRGQTLVEAIVALGILTMGFLGAVRLLVTSIGVNRTVSENYVATSIATEGVELVKNLLDTNVLRVKPWGDGIAAGDFIMEHGSTALLPFEDRFLTFDPATGFYGYGGPQTTKFKRRIRIAFVTNDEIAVSSVVTWIGRGGADLSVNVEDHFLNWRP